MQKRAILTVTYSLLLIVMSACGDAVEFDPAVREPDNSDIADDELLADDEYSDDDNADDYSGDESDDDYAVDDEADDDEADDDEADDDSDASSGLDVDADCSSEALGADDEFEFLTAYRVTNGELGQVCFGSADSTLESAWRELETITPRGQLSDLALFAAFASKSSSDEDTLAFVTAVDDEASAFQMSINLDTYEADANEASLTLAHEFAHVFTSIDSQIDRTVFAAEDCDAYYNGEGCFRDDSIMAQWVALFWGDGLIDEINPDEEPTGGAGEDRCDRNPGFFGPYAASNPEEDFAEAFSAYVYRLDADTEAQQAKLDWIDSQPGLAEFRDRAVNAGLGPLDNNFDRCG